MSVEEKRAGWREKARKKRESSRKEQEILDYIVYGYEETGDRWREKGLKHPRWYVGVTELSRAERRKKEHREFLKHVKGNTCWRNWVLKRKSEGYELEDVTEYHVLAELRGTKEEAEAAEVFHAIKHDALVPNGFCTKIGGYGGRVSEERRAVMSKNRSGGTSWNAGMTMPPPSAETLKKRKLKTCGTIIDHAKRRIEKEDKPTHRIVRLLIDADRPMREVEIREKVGIKRSACAVALQRLCGITNFDKPRKKIRTIKCLERIKIGNGTFYVAKPEFTSWMIGSQEYFKARRNRDWNIESPMLASLEEKRIKSTGRLTKRPPTSWFINTDECLKEQAAEQMGISYEGIQLFIREGKLKEIRRPSKVGYKRFVCALSLKEAWRKRKTLTH